MQQKLHCKEKLVSHGAEELSSVTGEGREQSTTLFLEKGAGCIQSLSSLFLSELDQVRFEVKALSCFLSHSHKILHSQLSLTTETKLPSNSRRNQNLKKHLQKISFKYRGHRIPT